MFGSTLPLMRFNKVLLESYAEDFINEVVPHECAHVVVYHLNRSAFHSGSKRPKPHGIEWQSVMRDVYRLEPKVTHNFALTSSESRQYSYVCGCVQRIHRISIIRHNKIKRGRARYLCKGCGDALVESVADSVSQNRG
jgi:SprT protein